ncbi:ankyrin repeat-containing domain protein [Jimgerdemannia flammicorona]|uniref:Ankyrin repeat-containing domain protein n=1 Tax=Jimgerdemannia flammicorona TaxID=994334 RepID=A0A433QYE1_9FUNG|nr:ankyrin repeat-containing domain protein [Jimgerdemannia flammicorona]
MASYNFSPEKTISDYLNQFSSTDTTCYSPLHIAAHTNATHIIIILIHELNADINAIGYSAVSALYVAVKYGCYDTVRLLCRYGASTATQNFTLKSPLQIAACNGHHKVVSFLCTNTTRRNHQNALYYTCEGGHVDTVHALLEFGGINVNARTWMGGHSTLHICVYHGHLQLVKILVVEFQVYVDIMDKLFGETPLHYAAWGTGYFHFRSSGSKIYDEQVMEDMVTLLIIELDADIYARTRYGATAYDIARMVMRTASVMEILVE